MNSKTLNHSYYKWTISSGDYYRTYESTETYDKKVAMKKRLFKLTKILLYMSLPYTLLILYVFYLR
jgi:fatty-acid desaturase